MTNHWVDFKNTDVFLVIGANPAENHPCGWKWAFQARDNRGAKIIHVDPRFTRTSATADSWAAIRAGSDVAFFGGLINYILENNLHHEEYVRLHTNASFLLAEGYSFTDGLFSGYDETARTYDTSTWDYERETEPAPGDLGGPTQTMGFARRDLSLNHPRSVFQLLKSHYSRYTPEVVEEVTGIPATQFLEIAATFGATGVPDKVGNIVYAVGLTHHTQGSQMIRAAAIVQLLLGNVGRPGGGLNAERGHANIQGNTDNAQSWDILPGYLAIPRPGTSGIDDYVDRSALTQLDPGAINFFGTNYRKFLISLLKSWYGDGANAANEYRFDYVPKPDKNWSWMTYYSEALAGRLHGLFNSGMSSVNIGPDSNRVLLVTLAGRRADTATLLLAGLAISLAAGAGTSLALALAPSPFAFYDAYDWLMGNFADRSLAQAAAALVPAGIAAALLLRRAHALDLTALGEEVAASLGLKPRNLALEVIALSAIAVGACVSVAGAIGFVGLVAPVFGRWISRGHPGGAMVPAALIGAILLAVADLVVRAVPLDRPIPVGVITALFGTPLFVWLVVSMRRRVTA